LCSGPAREGRMGEGRAALCSHSEDSLTRRNHPLGAHGKIMHAAEWEGAPNSPEYLLRSLVELLLEIR
jgi:hypothetical protein